MISLLRGTLILKEYPTILVDVRDVGYELETSMRTYEQLPELNQSIVLYTQQIIREDAHLFIGFVDPFERQLFRTLIKMNGIGPKLALAVLSNIEPHDFIQAIALQDLHRITKIPGIGKKMAERLLIELRDKIADVNSTSLNIKPEAGSYQEALSALTNLGYPMMHAQQLLKKIYREEMTSEMLIREALKEVAESR